MLDKLISGAEDVASKAADVAGEAAGKVAGKAAGVIGGIIIDLFLNPTPVGEGEDQMIQATEDSVGDNGVTYKNLRRLSDDEIESLGGEEGVREIKEQVKKSKSDLFVRS